MNRISTCRLRRTFGVLVLLAAWFAMSNHCALALMSGAPMTAKADVQTHCCPSQSESYDPQEGPSPGTCCKALRVLQFEAGGKLAKAPDAVLLAELLWAELAEVKVPDGSRPLDLAATGPPEVRSFAEVVLQRSLLTHAPPFAA